MTADLFELIEQRDSILAQEVAKRAELGWFDDEFTVYGCTFLQKGKQYYRLSSNAEKIYDFIEMSAKNEIVPTEIVYLTETFPVPAGMRDVVALEIKKHLAYKMQHEYRDDFLQYLERQKKRAAQDSGYYFLQKQQLELECCFDSEKLMHYEELVEYFYFCNKINEEHYYSIHRWLVEERKNFEEEAICGERYEKTFFGIAFLDDDKVQYVINARKESIYKKRDMLMLQGICTSPIFSKTYYYNCSVKLSLVKACFEQEIQTYFTEDAMLILKREICQNSNISKDEFAEKLQYVKNKFGVSAGKTFEIYGYRWGILY